uniref:ALMS motif domain-containing protein n=1 Tax=Glossina pallidipes TaxID=7398 RepID=A0A1A9ZS21_GLOPL
MFSSLATFLFGSSTSATTCSDTNQLATADNSVGNLRQTIDECAIGLSDAANTIEVTSLTPSVTGAVGTASVIVSKRGRNKRNKQTNKRKGENKNPKIGAATPIITKQLAPNDSCDEDIDENEWFIVEKGSENEKGDETLLPGSDSEGDNSTSIEVIKPKPLATSNSLVQQRRVQHINSHSLYGGPRPQKQRNYLQKTRTSNCRVNGLSVSTLSSSRNVGGGCHDLASSADGCVSRSLYVVTSQPETANTAANSGYGTDMKMDESWFVTPPPCFTSIGPINMETSPFENLLIEHPSMSVYHSIRSAEKHMESFLKLNTKDTKGSQKRARQTPEEAPRAVQSRVNTSRLDRQSAAQLKQEFLERQVQKNYNKKERRELCRGAIERSNKIRDFHATKHPQRRSDRQHCKIISGANNNRKSCSSKY